MAAGYISSTSGIGVADPYDAGLYEAQQDALNRLERQEKQRLADQEKKATQAKAMIGDLKYETGFMPEDAKIINEKFNKASAAKAKAYQLASSLPNSEATRIALMEAKEMEAEYKNIWNTSKQDLDLVTQFANKISKDSDLDEVNNAIASFRTKPITDRDRASLTMSYQQPSLDDILSEKVQKFEEQSLTPEVQKIGDRTYLAQSTTKLPEEQIDGMARSLYGADKKATSAANKVIARYAKDPVKYEQLRQQAASVGYNADDPNEIGSFVMAQTLRNLQRTKSSLTELKMTKQDELALKDFYKRQEEGRGLQKEAEKAIGFFSELTNMQQGNPRYLSSFQFVDPKDPSKKSYMIGRSLVGQTDMWVGEFDTVVEENGKQVPSKALNYIEYIVRDKDDKKLKYATTKSMDEYKRGVRATPFLPGNPEQLFSMYAASQKDPEKLRAALNLATKNKRTPDGKVDYNKIYQSNTKDEETIRRYWEKPFKEVQQPVEFGVATQQPQTQPAQQNQQQQAQSVKKFDYSKAGMQTKAKEMGISVDDLKKMILKKKPNATFE